MEIPVFRFKRVTKANTKTLKQRAIKKCRQIVTLLDPEDTRDTLVFCKLITEKWIYLTTLLCDKDLSDITAIVAFDEILPKKPYLERQFYVMSKKDFVDGFNEPLISTN